MSLYASQTHHMNITMIMASAIIGAIIGDNIGYFLGYKYGAHLLEKYGPKFGLTPDRQLLGQFLFRRIGNIAVFLARFLPVLRLFIAVLAGTSKMPKASFLCFNILGGIVWAGGYSLLAYKIGQEITKFSLPVGLSIGFLFGSGLLFGSFLLKRHERYFIFLAKKDSRRRGYSSPKKKHSKVSQ